MRHTNHAPTDPLQNWSEKAAFITRKDTTRDQVHKYRTGVSVFLSFLRSYILAKQLTEALWSIFMVTKIVTLCSNIVVFRSVAFTNLLGWSHPGVSQLVR